MPMADPLLPINSAQQPQKDPNEPLAAYLPGLLEQVLISWVFIVASIALLLGFIFLQINIHDPTSYFALWPNVGNMTLMVSCFCWFLGFVLLTHWTVYRIGDTSSLGFVGTLFKLLASVFFNMQPITAMWMMDGAGVTVDGSISGPAGGFAPGVSFGTGWSNFLGISLFHLGNVFSVCYMLRADPAAGGMDYQNKGAHGNLPVWGMLIYLAATTFLVTANALAYFGDQKIIDEAYGLGWGVTAACQYAGASLLLLGSLFYLYFSTATAKSGLACITP